MHGGVAPLSGIPAPTLDLSDRKDPQLELDEFNDRAKNSMRTTEESKCYIEMKEKTEKCGTKEECTTAGIIKKDFCGNKISYNRSEPLEEHCKKMVEPSVSLCIRNVEECRKKAVDEFTSCILPSLTVPEEAQPKVVTNIGCYTDDKRGHMDNTTRITDVKMTQDFCIKRCDEKNFKYASMQNGDTCVCGNDSNYDNKKPVYTKTDDKECNSVCSGELRDTRCGGPLKNALYDTTTQKYIGCRNDDTVGQFINYRFDKQNSVAKCVEKCKQGDFKYAALQASNWCACGNDSEFNKTKDSYRSVPSEECNIPCKGKATETCGGLMKNSIYRIESAAPVKK